MTILYLVTDINITNQSSESELNDFRVYVIKPIEENFTSDKVSTLLVDKSLRDKYDDIIKNYTDDIREFETKLYNKSGVYYSKNSLRNKLFKDFGLDEQSDWNDFFKHISNELEEKEINFELVGIVYSDLINEKTIKIIQDSDFQKNIEKYLEGLNELINSSEFLNDDFNNYNAISLHKAFSKHNMFAAKNRIILNNDKEINNSDEWEEVINSEIERIESKLDIQFRNIENSIEINNNKKGRKFKDIILKNKFLLSYFKDIDKLKQNLWLSYIEDEMELFISLNKKIKSYTYDIQKIYKRAEKVSFKWHYIVREFNNRFDVPFELFIDNQSSVLLKDEAPHILFKIKNETDGNTFNKREILKTLSSGEKRALYLLNILFEIENLKKFDNKTLLIFDDITDSFDYKNKYAIIEYLNDISKDNKLDLLLLTHNFDFYRTVSSRLDISYNMSFMVQKNLEDNLIMSNIGFQKNILQHYLKQIRKYGLKDIEKQKMFLASIPLFRNLYQLDNKDITDKFLTKILHIKKDSLNITVEDVWEKISCKYNLGELNQKNNDKLIIKEIFRISKNIIDNIGESIDRISLKNKIILSIGIRLKAEEFLINKLEDRSILEEISSNQTRELYNILMTSLMEKHKKLIEKVLIMTPENIHLNAFMYEPIIDISDWHLRHLYKELLELEK